MNASKRPDPPQARREQRTGERSQQPGAPGAQEDTPASDMQGQDAGTPASGTANRGSPVASVMKQFQKTKAESGETDSEEGR